MELEKGEISKSSKGLVELKQILRELNLPFILEGGVLLGAVREGGFIPWDDDVGVALRAEDLYPKREELLRALGAAGFQFHSMDSSYENLKINVTKYDTRYELLAWYLKGRMRRRAHFRMPKRFLDVTQDITFLGEMYPCPSPPEAYLRHFYGNWKKPKKEGRIFTIRCFDQGVFWGRHLRKLREFFSKRIR
ncbi:MAG: LicD family protein [Deltaproteobacteria bacterium]